MPDPFPDPFPELLKNQLLSIPDALPEEEVFEEELLELLDHELVDLV